MPAPTSDPDVIAASTLEAMREDRFHIFSHPEFKDELCEMFDEVLADFRDYPMYPGYEKRTDFEKIRRESYEKQRKGLKKNLSPNMQVNALDHVNIIVTDVDATARFTPSCSI